MWKVEGLRTYPEICDVLNLMQDFQIFYKNLHYILLPLPTLFLSLTLFPVQIFVLRYSFQKS